MYPSEGGVKTNESSRGDNLGRAFSNNYAAEVLYSIEIVN